MEDAHRVKAQSYCNICKALTDHVVQDCPHNLKNTKCCHIYETHSHRTSKCYLNARNQANVQTMYHKEATDQTNNYGQRNYYYGRG